MRALKFASLALHIFGWRSEMRGKKPDQRELDWMILKLS